MKQTDIRALRNEYAKHSLDQTEVQENPINQFMIWFQEAVDTEVMEPNAMNLATVDSDGKPHSRIMLLKGVEENTFKFYTNYGSDKGQQISSNENVSLCFFWIELERQVRIEGVAQKLPREESEAYFKSRPHMSQVGAHASSQSEEVKSREFLDQKFEKLINQFEEGKVPIPENWGGFKVIPNYIEFWQGRPSRLHDRIVYQKIDDNWLIKRLSP